MSGLETVQRWYVTGDVSLLHPNIIWQVFSSFPAGGTYRGRQSVLNTFFPAIQKRFRSICRASGGMVARRRYGHRSG